MWTESRGGCKTTSKVEKENPHQLKDVFNKSTLSGWKLLGFSGEMPKPHSKSQICSKLSDFRSHEAVTAWFMVCEFCTFLIILVRVKWRLIKEESEVDYTLCVILRCFELCRATHNFSAVGIVPLSAEPTLWTSSSQGSYLSLGRLLSSITVNKGRTFTSSFANPPPPV